MKQEMILFHFRSSRTVLVVGHSPFVTSKEILVKLKKIMSLEVLLQASNTVLVSIFFVQH